MKSTMRKIYAVIIVDEKRPIKENLGTIEYLENEFNWLEQSGIYLETARILDEDDKADKAKLTLLKEIL